MRNFLLLHIKTHYGTRGLPILVTDKTGSQDETYYVVLHETKRAKNIINWIFYSTGKYQSTTPDPPFVPIAN